MESRRGPRGTLTCCFSLSQFSAGWMSLLYRKRKFWLGSTSSIFMSSLAEPHPVCRVPPEADRQHDIDQNASEVISVHAYFNGRSGEATFLKDEQNEAIFNDEVRQDHAVVRDGRDHLIERQWDTAQVGAAGGRVCLDLLLHGSERASQAVCICTMAHHDVCRKLGQLRTE